MPIPSLWPRFQKYFLDYGEIGFSLDISRMRFPDDFFEEMRPRCEKALAAMRDLEAGGIANPDEDRMVGHYWLRDPALAPNDELRADVEKTKARIQKFASDIHVGRISTPDGRPFEHLLLIGIGGSALGPQFISDALGSTRDPMNAFFFDNTDPDGFDRVLNRIREDLNRTLAVVISKSGGTKETRNGMLEARAAFEKAGLDFGKQAVAVTGLGSELDQYAQANNWLARFPMFDWIGGRTSVMSAVGLLPAALQGIDIDSFLAGAAAMDVHTRQPDVAKNAAMLLALMWFYAGDGQGRKDMVILPYKDRLALFSKYLQQLVMESLGKERDLAGRIARVDAFNVGLLIALYERAVGFYGSLVNVNAYHQPGVEAGKKAATRILQLQPKVLAQLSQPGETAEEIARAIEAEPEEVYHVARHLAANDPAIRASGGQPGTEKFSRIK